MYIIYKSVADFTNMVLFIFSITLVIFINLLTDLEILRILIKTIINMKNIFKDFINIPNIITKILQIKL